MIAIHRRVLLQVICTVVRYLLFLFLKKYLWIFCCLNCMTVLSKKYMIFSKYTTLVNHCALYKIPCTSFVVARFEDTELTITCTWCMNLILFPAFSDDILDYIMVRKQPSVPGRSRPRFSLYLSAKLMYGCVKLYRKQTQYLLG